MCLTMICVASPCAINTRLRCFKAFALAGEEWNAKITMGMAAVGSRSLRSVCSGELRRHLSNSRAGSASDLSGRKNVPGLDHFNRTAGSRYRTAKRHAHTAKADPVVEGR